MGSEKESQKYLPKHKKGQFWTLYIFFKTVHAIETIFYSHSLSYYGTMCATGSKSYGWDLRKNAKIDSKNTKNTFWTFHTSSKTVQAIETTIYSHSTSY